MRLSLIIAFLTMLCLGVGLALSCGDDDDDSGGGGQGDDDDNNGSGSPDISNPLWDIDSIAYDENTDTWTCNLYFDICDEDNDLSGGAVHIYHAGTQEYVDGPKNWDDYPGGPPDAPDCNNPVKVQFSVKLPDAQSDTYYELCVDIQATDGPGNKSNKLTNYCLKVQIHVQDDDDDDDIGCNTWLDPGTGLMWQIRTTLFPPEDYLLLEAINYCENLDCGGYNDWRLPTISELRSLIRGCDQTMTGGACEVTDSCLDSDCWNPPYCYGGPGLDGPGPDGMYWPSELGGTVQCCMYWSSSVAPDVNGAWSVYFDQGAISLLLPDFHIHARCVR